MSLADGEKAKVISFTDLAGHERYLRTTVFGLLSSEPNYCLLMVAANNGIIGMSKQVSSDQPPDQPLTSDQRTSRHSSSVECTGPGHNNKN